MVATNCSQMQEACGNLAEQQHAHPPSSGARGDGRRRTIALGMPVISSLTRYDGEEHDDMRVPQACEPRPFHRTLFSFPSSQPLPAALLAARNYI